MTRHVCPMITARPNDRSGLAPLMSRFAILAKDKKSGTDLQERLDFFRKQRASTIAAAVSSG